MGHTVGIPEGLLPGLCHHLLEHVVLPEQFFFPLTREPLDSSFDTERKALTPDRLFEYEL